MLNYIIARLREVMPDVTVRSMTYDGGQAFEVRAGSRYVYVSTSWGDNPESVVAFIVRRLGLTLP